ncbi:MAG: hypothetical protein Q9210_005083 [Variospora velana]
MAPIMNYQTGLESIGSVAANFARTEAGEKTRLLYESPESAYVLQMHGQAAHDDYLAWEKTSGEQRTLDDKKRRERRRRQLERCRRIRKTFQNTGLFVNPRWSWGNNNWMDDQDQQQTPHKEDGLSVHYHLEKLSNSAPSASLVQARRRSEHFLALALEVN